MPNKRFPIDYPEKSNVVLDDEILLVDSESTGFQYQIKRTKLQNIQARVQSVNGKIGVVVLNTDDVLEGTNKYVTQADKDKLVNVPADTNSEITALQQIKADKLEVLTRTNTDIYVPATDYNPATKQYVDVNVGVQEVIAGEGITVDNTNPAKPIVSTDSAYNKNILVSSILPTSNNGILTFVLEDQGGNPVTLTEDIVNRCKVTLLAYKSPENFYAIYGAQRGDAVFWGGNSSGLLVNIFWTNSSPANTYSVNFQPTTVKIKLGSSGGGLSNARIIITDITGNEFKSLN